MNLSELNDLDFEDMGSWPAAAQAIVVVLAFVVTLFGGYWLYLEDQWSNLGSAIASEETLKQKYNLRYRQNSMVPSLKKQLKEGETIFSEMLAQLPKSVNVAELLADISDSGLKEGLSFESITPEEEVQTRFYSELPIRITLRGEYHQFGRFVSRLSALQRIVTLEDISIAPYKNDTSLLVMKATAKTYWSETKDKK